MSNSDDNNNKKIWYCYILKNSYEEHKNRTYNGSTNNLKRRLRQHNGDIKGGAIYTKKFGNKSWEIYALVTGFPDHKNALQCEWKIRHPNNKRKRTGKYNNPRGRIKGLCEVLRRNRWTMRSVYNNMDMDLKVWIIKGYEDLLINLPDNIEINVVDKINLDNL